MKTIIFFTLFCLPSISLTQPKLTDSLYKKHYELTEKLNQVAIHIEDAGKEMWLSGMLTVTGSLTSAALIVITKDGSKFSVYIPALVGSIFGIVNYFLAADDLKQVGRLLKKETIK